MAEVHSEPEESHWRKIEQRQRSQSMSVELRGASAASVTQALSHSPRSQGELIIGLSLLSESERSFKSQNDTDSDVSGTQEPNLRTVVIDTAQQKLTVTPNTSVSDKVKLYGGSDVSSPPLCKSALPPSQSPKQQGHAFAKNDSFYLPSSAQESSESTDEGEPPPLPDSAPPSFSVDSKPHPSSGATAVSSFGKVLQPAASVSVGTFAQALNKPAESTFMPGVKKTFTSKVTLHSVGQSTTKKLGQNNGVRGEEGRKQLQTTSSVGISIRQRIAQIERQLKVSAKSNSQS